MINNKVVVLKKVELLQGSPIQWSKKDIKIIKAALFNLLDQLNVKSLRNLNVIIHPNLVRPDPQKIPASFTDPRVIIALTELLSDLHVRKIQIGENPGFGFPARKAFEIVGIVPFLKKLGAEILFFDEQKWIDFNNSNGRIFKKVKVAKSILDADYFVNLPKWKTHMLTKVSLGIKNLLGIIHDDFRMLYHRNDINEKIVDLLCIRQPDLNVIDGLWAMEGQAPFHGKAIKNFNLLAASEDVIAVDSIASEMMGFQKMEIPHLVLAKKRYWNSQNININVIGETKHFHSYFFERPTLSSAGWFDNIHCIECGVCNGCLSAIRHSLDKLNFENKLKNIPEVTIVSGMPMPNHGTLEAWSGQLILFGNCASGFQFYTYKDRSKALWVPGCPPHVLDLEKILQKL